MKKHLLIALVTSLAAANMSAQTITLQFTGRDATDHYVQLDSVIITNLTRNWQETILWPDTTLVLQVGTGIEEGGSGITPSLQLSQNNPNPFSGMTEVELAVADKGRVTIEISDINGRLVETFHETSLQPGVHRFRVSLATAGTYTMTARQSSRSSSIKMVCSGGSSNTIEYVGWSEKTALTPKSSTSQPFDLGDLMEYEGYAVVNGAEVVSQTVTQVQNASEMVVLRFIGVVSGDGMPCPDAATVTDHEGNVYNTVQIGGMCWTRENMRCSTSPNGYLTAGGNMVSTNVAYYYDYSTSSIPLVNRGLLYNWAGAMDTSATAFITDSFISRRGICPAGWHVPNDDEWSNLFNYVSNVNAYRCNDHITYIAKSLASKDYWDTFSGNCVPGNNQNDNNATGFSAIPAGCGNTSFTSSGFETLFWTSTSYNGAFATHYSIAAIRATVYKSDTNKQYGYSVRCVRD
jgi:uncharacterized protein (TIGR02145 family)